MGLVLDNMRLVAAGAGAVYPVHAVGIDNRTLPGVTHAIETMKGDHLARRTVARRTAGALAVFDWLLGRGISPTTAPATILAGVRAWLLASGVRTPMSSSGPWREAKGSDAALAYASEALTGLRRAYGAMCDAGLYPFSHPLELSEEQLRTQRLRYRQSGRRRGRRASLSANLIRFDRPRYSPPRRTMVGLVRDVVATAEAAGWSEGEVLYLLILIDGGCRPADPTRFLVGDWYEAEACGASCESTSKGHGDLRVKKVRWTEGTQARLRAWFDGDRRRQLAGARAVADYVALGDSGDLDLLGDPLLVDASGRGIDYDRISRRFRRDIADRVFDPRTGRRPLVRPTLHWCRHLYVYDNLALIDLLQDPDEREREKDLLVAYLFWSTGKVMLATYGREFEEARQAAAMVASMRRREKMVEAVRRGEAHPAKAPAASTGTPPAIGRMFRDRRQDRYRRQDRAAGSR